MEYDFRTTYDSNPPSYSRPPTSSMYAQPPSLYPKTGGGGSVVGRNPPFHPAPTPPTHQPTSGTGIRIAIKPEYRITPPPPLLSNMGEIPRSNFTFDFEFERNVIAEMTKENPSWSRFPGIDNNVPPTPTESHSSSYFSRGPTADPIVNKYVAAGLSSEAVPLAVANYGDNPTKVKEFASGFNRVREMGFLPNNVAEALLMYDNDTDRALTHLLNNTSMK